MPGCSTSAGNGSEGPAVTRYIRLKEWGQNVDVFREPSDDYLAACDGSLWKEQYRFRTDINGFISTGRGTPESTRPLLVLGGSVVENMYVHEGRRMCDILEDCLLNNGYNLRVLNGGVSGATMLHLLNSFLNKGLPLKPAGIVLFSSINDITAALDEVSFWSDQEYITPLMNSGCQTHTSDRKNLESCDFSERWRLLEVFQMAAAVHNIPLWLTTLAHRMDATDPYLVGRYAIQEGREKAINLRKELNQQTRRFSIENAVGLIDLEREFYERSDIMYDEFHLNELGSSIVAHYLFSQLRSSSNARLLHI
jgi:hypothetical protein